MTDSARGSQGGTQVKRLAAKFSDLCDAAMSLIACACIALLDEDEP